MGSHPYHRPSCQSRLFPSPCRYCGRDIFVYFCSCHSGRALEENHDPWTPHDCVEAELDRLETQEIERRREAFKKKYSGSRLITAADLLRLPRKKRPFLSPLNSQAR